MFLPGVTIILHYLVSYASLKNAVFAPGFTRSFSPLWARRKFTRSHLYLVLGKRCELSAYFKFDDVRGISDS